MRHFGGVAINGKQWQKIKQAYLKGGESYASLATRFQIGKRTIEQRAAVEGWKALRDGQEISSLAIAEEVSEVLQQKVPARGVRPHLDTTNPEAYIELALNTCYADLEDAEIRSKSKGEVISSIEKMLKLQHQLSLYKYEEKLKQIEVETKESDLILKQRQVNPPTAKEWARLAFQYEMSSSELLEELRAVIG